MIGCQATTKKGSPCKRRAMSGSVFCRVHCNHSDQSNASGSASITPANSSALKDDWATLQHVWKVVAMLAVSNGPGAFLGMWLYGAPKSDQLIQGFFLFYVATFPLTTAVAIIGIALIREWFRDGCAVQVFMAVVLFAATIFANSVAPIVAKVFALKVPSLALNDWPSVLNPGSFIWANLTAYFEVYGAWTFFVSLIAGGFIALGAGAVMWPHHLAAVTPQCPAEPGNGPDQKTPDQPI